MDFDKLAEKTKIIQFDHPSLKCQEVSRALGKLQMSAVCDDNRSVDEVIKLAEPIMDEIRCTEVLRKYKEQIIILLEELVDSESELEIVEKVL